MERLKRRLEMSKLQAAVSKALYWIAGAAVQALVTLICLALGIGILVSVFHTSRNLFGCCYEIDRFLNTPLGVLVSASIVVGVYLQLKHPVDVSRAS